MKRGDHVMRLELELDLVHRVIDVNRVEDDPDAGVYEYLMAVAGRSDMDGVVFIDLACNKRLFSPHRWCVTAQLVTCIECVAIQLP